MAGGIWRSARGRTYLIIALIALLCLIVMNGSVDNGASATPMEKRMEGVLSQIDGAGKVKVMVREDKDEIVGVLVVCEGARDVGVRLRIQKAVNTLLAIDNDRIDVALMEGSSFEKDD